MRRSDAVCGAVGSVVLAWACVLFLGACTGAGTSTTTTTTATAPVPEVRGSASPQPAPTAQPSTGAVDDADADDAWARAKALIDEYYWVVPYEEDIPARNELAAEVWAGALATVCPPDGLVSCAPDTFAPVMSTWGTVGALDTSLEVVAEDKAQVRAALAATAERYYLIDTDGREWTWAELEEEPMADEEGPLAGEMVFTPAYVSEFVETDEAVGFWFDVEGNPYPDMARAQIRVLLEELDRVGITEARVRPLTDPSFG